MKTNIVRTVCFATLLVSLAAVASAQGSPSCSNRLAAGDWGYTKTGTLFLPSGTPVPFATVGKLTLDRHGTLSGVNNGSVGGTISQDVLSGTFTVNPDCARRGDGRGLRPVGSPASHPRDGSGHR